MGTSDRPESDPARDPRADYDYAADAVARPGLVADLDERVAGEVRFDDYSRQLYATDASIYEVTPVGVVYPESTADVAAVVSYCAERSIPVLPRGGGTSLAGQAVNEAVVLDFTRQFEKKFVQQGSHENRTIEDSLSIAWDLLSILPEDELIRIDPEIREKYLEKEE
jgi:FAD/FMN-containing dehydrogenase